MDSNADLCEDVVGHRQRWAVIIAYSDVIICFSKKSINQSGNLMKDLSMKLMSQQMFFQTSKPCSEVVIKLQNP